MIMHFEFFDNDTEANTKYYVEGGCSYRMILPDGEPEIIKVADFLSAVSRMKESIVNMDLNALTSKYEVTLSNNGTSKRFIVETSKSPVDVGLWFKKEYPDWFVVSLLIATKDMIALGLPILNI